MRRVLLLWCCVIGLAAALAAGCGEKPPVPESIQKPDPARRLPPKT
ncbi:MAG: hypothetical protein IT429_04335 [Gemmataceae bacterium]|nr:hypothetical protein [Gemmataceae bacterium]